MHKYKRALAYISVGIAALANMWVFDALAQTFPIKPIRIVVGFSAGSATDVVARMLAQEVTRNVGQPVVVENRTGASGSIATERVASSPADGYTLLLMVASDTVQPALRAKLPYDLERDFAPISLLVIGPIVLVVHPSVPVRSVKELLALARSQPGKLSYGSSGAGSRAHFAGELLNLMGKVNLVHVPYKGSTDAVIATTGGQIEVSFPSITALLPLLEVGKLRALAVTSNKRVSSLPALPTIHESGLQGYDIVSWYGITAPAGVPKEIVAQLNAVIVKAVSNRNMKESLSKQGLEVQTNSPEQFAAFIKEAISQNVKLVKLAGLKRE